MLSKIDELNTYEYIYSDKEVDKMLSEYFDVMDISKEQKKKRESIAIQVRESLLFLFALITTASAYGYLDKDYILQQFRERFASVLLDNTTRNEYIDRYFANITQNIVDVTMSNFSGETDYWVSDERAILIAGNEANSIENYNELEDAMEKGYTMKEWRAELDNKTRKDHRIMNGTKIPIEEYFQFDDCEMIAPHDVVNGTERQNANCRCVCHYS